MELKNDGAAYLSIIVPVYNEEANLRNSEKELHDALQGLGAYEIIWIDDGSKDSSPAILKDLNAKNPANKVIFFRRNYGQTAAMDAGFQSAKGEVLIPIDSDLQNDPRDIPRLLEELNRGFDVVSGWRKNRKDNVIRRFPSRIANRLIRRLTGVHIHDYGCTLKAYRAELIRDINLYGEMHRFIPALVAAQGGRVTEIPVNHRPRVAGISKYGLSRTFRVILDILTVVFLGRFLTRPLHFFGSLAITVFGVSTILAGWIVFDKFAHGIFVHRNPLFILMTLLFTASLQLLTSGLLGEIVIRGYFEGQGRKIYKTRTTLGF